MKYPFILAARNIFIFTKKRFKIRFIKYYTKYLSDSPWSSPIWVMPKKIDASGLFSIMTETETMISVAELRTLHRSIVAAQEMKSISKILVKKHCDKTQTRFYHLTYNATTIVKQIS